MDVPKFRLLTEEEILQNFDVDYIRTLINYSLKRDPIYKQLIVHKPLYEEDETGSELYDGNNVETLRQSSQPDNINDSDYVTIPRELYEKLMQNKNKDNNNK